MVDPLVEKKRIWDMLREPLKNKFASFAFLFSLLSNIAIWLLLYIFIKQSNETTLLHYNIYFGVDLIGNWYNVYLIPLSGIVIILVNYILGAIMYLKKSVIFYLAIGFTMPIQILLGIAAVLIILQNI